MQGEDLVQFGKYKGRTGFELLGDDKYVIWLYRQSWLKEREPKLYDFIRSQEASDYREVMGLGEIKPKETEFIYFIKSGERDKNGKMRIKIGKTENDIEKRKKQLQTGNPDDLELIQFIEVRKELDVEKVLHEKFSDKKIRGEWYSLSDDEINDAIENHEKGVTSWKQKITGYIGDKLSGLLSYVW